MTRPHFLSDAPDSPGAQHLYEHDLAEDGYVMNVSRLWAHAPVAHEKLFDLITHVWESNGMTFRQRGILVGAAASASATPSARWCGAAGWPPRPARRRRRRC